MEIIVTSAAEAGMPGDFMREARFGVAGCALHDWLFGAAAVDLT